MSIPVQIYRDVHQLREIVRVSTKFYEAPGGYQDETTTEIVVCPHEDGYYEFEIQRLSFFGPSSTGPSDSIVGRKKTTKAEYQKLRTKYGIIDGDDYEKARIEIAELEKKREALRPKCPKCGRGMVTRNGAYGQFLGCPAYPNCKGTEEINPKIVAKIAAINSQISDLRLQL